MKNFNRFFLYPIIISLLAVSVYAQASDTFGMFGSMFTSLWKVLISILTYSMEFGGFRIYFGTTLGYWIVLWILFRALISKLPLFKDESMSKWVGWGSAGIATIVVVGMITRGSAMITSIASSGNMVLYFVILPLIFMAIAGGTTAVHKVWGGSRGYNPRDPFSGSNKGVRNYLDLRSRDDKIKQRLHDFDAGLTRHEEFLERAELRVEEILKSEDANIHHELQEIVKGLNQDIWVYNEAKKLNALLHSGKLPQTAASQFEGLRNQHESLKSRFIPLLQDINAHIPDSIGKTEEEMNLFKAERKDESKKIREQRLSERLTRQEIGAAQTMRDSGEVQKETQTLLVEASAERTTQSQLRTTTKDFSALRRDLAIKKDIQRRVRAAISLIQRNDISGAARQLSGTVGGEATVVRDEETERTDTQGRANQNLQLQTNPI